MPLGTRVNTKALSTKQLGFMIGLELVLIYDFALLHFMSSVTITSPHAQLEFSGVSEQGVFRGHAFSFLVAVSVLFGSMFTAHSAIVELASVNAGQKILSFVESVRSEIAEVPSRASQRMASVAASQEHNLFATESALLGGGITSPSETNGIADLYLGLVQGGSAINPLHEPPKVAIYGISAPQGAPPAVQGSEGNTPSFDISSIHTLALSKSAWIVAEPYVDLAEALLTQLDQIENQVTRAFVEGTYAWVDISTSLPEVIVRAAYTAGDKTIAVAAEGIPALKLERIVAVPLWVDTANELARMVVEPQIALGHRILHVATEARAISYRGQQIAGERLGEVAWQVSSAGTQFSLSVPRAATAAVADFLILEE